MKTRVPLILATALLLPVLVLSACVRSGIQRIEDAFAANKTIVIFPKTFGETVWMAQAASPAGDSRQPGFAAAIPLGTKYVAAIVSPGTYYVDSVEYVHDAGAISISGANAAAGVPGLGPVQVVKTPEKEMVTRQISAGEMLERDTDADGNPTFSVPRRSAAESWVEEEADITSEYRYAVRVAPPGAAARAAVAGITVMPGEVVLMPGVWLEADLDFNACAESPKNKKKGIVARFLSSKKSAVGPALWDALPREGANGFETWYFSCPVKELRLYTVPADRDELLRDIDNPNVPPALAARIRHGLVVKDAQWGALPQQPHEKRPFRYADRGYSFENTNYPDAEHVFRAR